jgi:hypothetical protein
MLVPVTSTYDYHTNKNKNGLNSNNIEDLKKAKDPNQQKLLVLAEL